MKDAFYFPHDSNARHDEDIIPLRFKYGWEGYGIYWALIEKLRETKSFKIAKKYDVIGYDLHVPAEKIKSIVEDFDLFKTNRSKFWSESLIDRMIEARAKSVKARMSARERWGETIPGSRSERMSAARRKGSHTKAEWEEMKKFFGECVKCGKKESEAPIEKAHIILISKGGSDSISNIQPFCEECNSKKKNDEVDYRIEYCKANGCEMPAKWVENACKERKGKERKGKEKKKRITWLTDYAIIYELKCNAELPYGKASKYLKKVEDRIGHEAGVRAFKNYCEKTPVRFISFARFQQTLKEWQNESAREDTEHTGSF